MLSPASQVFKEAMLVCELPHHIFQSRQCAGQLSITTRSVLSPLGRFGSCYICKAQALCPPVHPPLHSILPALSVSPSAAPPATSLPPSTTHLHPYLQCPLQCPSTPTCYPGLVLVSSPPPLCIPLCTTFCIPLCTTFCIPLCTTFCIPLWVLPLSMCLLHTPPSA